MAMTGEDHDQRGMPATGAGARADERREDLLDLSRRVRLVCEPSGSFFAVQRRRGFERSRSHQHDPQNVSFTRLWDITPTEPPFMLS
jgi:hypothetical protein